LASTAVETGFKLRCKAFTGGKTLCISNASPENIKNGIISCNRDAHMKQSQCKVVHDAPAPDARESSPTPNLEVIKAEEADERARRAAILAKAETLFPASRAPSTTPGSRCCHVHKDGTLCHAYPVARGLVKNGVIKDASRCQAHQTAEVRAQSVRAPSVTVTDVEDLKSEVAFMKAKMAAMEAMFNNMSVSNERNDSGKRLRTDAV
jgi:hypothetical protein